MSAEPEISLPLTVGALQLRDIAESDLPFLQVLYRSIRRAELAQTEWTQEEKDAFCDAQFDLPMPGGTALNALIDNQLRDFSVSQCCQLLWTATEKATDYRVRKVTTARHASKYLIDICQLLADRTRAEGWEIKGFAREFQLPRSQVSHVLHDVFLRHGEVGFSGPINPGVATRRLDDK